ncbi:MAG TPA: Gldg family protein [Woeseiaceae bacterium]|nr:Gldg family protein [Woeseiaceae bacterium]
MGTQSQRRLSSMSLVLLALAFIAAVIVSNQLFRGWRIDLTENNLYTLSDGTQRILDKIDEPINLYFYFSDQATEDLPGIRAYANRVRELLEEFEAEAEGKIRLEVIDPLPFSVDEDRAAQFGLQGIQTAASPDPIYMGLAGTNSVDDEEVIRFFEPEKEELLEYDIARLVSILSRPEPTVIGLISGVGMTGDFDPRTQQMQSPWIAYTQAQQLFDIRNLGTDFTEIGDDIGLLWIVQPKNLSDATLYAIDQFMMRGGKALVFVDPLAAADPATMPQGMPQGMPPQAQSSNLPKLFRAWGIKFSTDDVVADVELALRISSRMSPRPVLHPGMLGITAAQTNSEDVVTADLELINMGTAGHFEFDEDVAPTVEPLITSSTSAATMSASEFRFLSDPSRLLEDFTPTGEQYVLAARISGNLKSAFPDGPPETGEAADNPQEDAAAAEGGAKTTDAAAQEDAAPVQDEASPEADSPEAEPGTDPAGDAAAEGDGHLSESAAPANLIVVADVDLLSDRMWVQVQNFFGQQIANAFADNGTFVANALENLSGSNDLIAVRSRATYSRPFTRVEELRAGAQAKFQETEQRLQQELEETEARLTELQSGRQDTGNILMTPEQQAEIDRFIDRRAEIRQELRAVQRGLDRDIERLGTVLKVVNIALVPVLLIAFVLFAVWRRHRKQQA